MAPENLRNAPVLPTGVVGMVDLGRLIRELERIEAVIKSDEIRSGADVRLPKFSALLDQLAEANRLDLRDAHTRHSLLEFLKILRKDAPKLHVSFSADPSPVFLAKLMLWLRTHVHPHVLVAVGLQPGIGAGCVLRTTNRYFDMSLGKTFADKRTLLMQRMRASSIQSQPPTKAPSQAVGAEVRQ
ncbi:hypothetical protein CSA80_02425 [Candidatus Saccharibacteria bacterium]|nr:MAG: hypothetical protein CSA80_02425 [Candidatus Saccharibacteria bacterium]